MLCYARSCRVHPITTLTPAAWNVPIAACASAAVGSEGTVSSPAFASPYAVASVRALAHTLLVA
jgi:hypothetical protein